MRRGYTLIEFLIVVSIVGILAAIFYPVFMRPREIGHRATCSSNLKQVGLGFLQYTQDYDERLPPAAISAVLQGDPLRTPYGWADAVQPYIKPYQVFRCPENHIDPSNSSIKATATDYYLNRNLARRNVSFIDSPNAVILVGEGNDGHDTSDARYSRINVPLNWATDPNSPLLRHTDRPGGHYLFLDGHVKYLAGTSIDFGFKRVPPKRR